MKKLFVGVMLLASLFWLDGGAVYAADTEARLLATGCFGCHGVNGESRGPATPIIAGMSYNYLVGALLSRIFAAQLVVVTAPDAPASAPPWPERSAMRY